MKSAVNLNLVLSNVICNCTSAPRSDKCLLVSLLLKRRDVRADERAVISRGRLAFTSYCYCNLMPLNRHKEEWDDIGDRAKKRWLKQRRTSARYLANKVSRYLYNNVAGWLVSHKARGTMYKEGNLLSQLAR